MIIDKSVKVEQLKVCAETIIKNAESIVGDERYQGCITVSIMLDPEERPYIRIYKDIYPDETVKANSSIFWRVKL